MSICISKGTCIAFLSKNCNKPVSLCNVVYKIISKLLVAKLKPLLDKIISLAQLAFIPNRWIAENHVTVQEILHSFKTWKTKPDLMAIKLDLQKAYDRVSWRFIQAVLLHLGLTRHSQPGSYPASPQSHLKFLSMEVKQRASNLAGTLDKGTYSHHIYSFWCKKFSPECLTQNSGTKISMALRPTRVDQLSPT